MGLLVVLPAVLKWYLRPVLPARAFAQTPRPHVPQEERLPVRKQYVAEQIAVH